MNCYRWVKMLPFGIMLVHNASYSTKEDAKMDLVRLKNSVSGFVLMNDKEISENSSFKVSVPLKR